MSILHTEFEFSLPHGYVDAEGNLHRDGVMRMATAYDEIAPMQDPRVGKNPGYHIVITLSRVLTKLGELEFINPKVIENLFAGDLAYLQDMYQRINYNGNNNLAVTCPSCGEHFEVAIERSGE